LSLLAQLVAVGVFCRYWRNWSVLVTPNRNGATEQMGRRPMLRTTNSAAEQDRQGANVGAARRLVIPHPPKIEPVFTHHFRFQREEI
jgi:hypothetical protein